jgi:hypothetical protein
MTIALQITIEQQQIQVRVLDANAVIYQPASKELCHAYALLALARVSKNPERLVSAEELHSLPVFAKSKLRSVASSFGSRHIGSISQRDELAGLFFFLHITKAWRLNLRPEAIDLRCGTDLLASHLGLKSAVQSGGQIDPSWTIHAVRCLLATDYGQRVAANPVEAGQAALAAAGSDTLRGLVSRFLIVRTKARVSTEAYEDAVGELFDAIEASGTGAQALGRSMRLRTIALGHFVRRQDRLSWASGIAELKLKISESSAFGDFGAQALMHEVLAMLLVRQNAFDEDQRTQIREHYQTAIALQIHCRDTVRLQTTIHNAACFEAAATTSWRAPAMAWQIEQVELSIETANVTSTHAGSAQSFCLMMMLHASRGDFADAQQQADIADDWLQDLENPLEHAHRAFAQGHLHWWQYDLLGQQAEHKRQALQHLQKALALFQAQQDRNYEITLATQIKHLKKDIPLTRESMRIALQAG